MDNNKKIKLSMKKTLIISIIIFFVSLCALISCNEYWLGCGTIIGYYPVEYSGGYEFYAVRVRDDSGKEHKVYVNGYSWVNSQVGEYHCFEE